uniref:Fe2OG dioxygenase domain-containing protein n=1 Tax=Amphora coffeiformis TaxID=265554 RepID=A0A7S3LHH2_9STRA|eukprot:scaffold5540_cov181-Amphora_coffeaeformis.AAC.18
MASFAPLVRLLQLLVAVRLSAGLILVTTHHPQLRQYRPQELAFGSGDIRHRHRKNARHTLLLHPTGTTSTDLQTELNAAGLGLCHGILHASGVRRLSDIKYLTNLQIIDMGVDNFDRRNLLGLIDKLGATPTTTDSSHTSPNLSTSVQGAFEDQNVPNGLGGGETAKQDFVMQVVCGKNDIFRGRLFTPQQCLQINRMAEYHAYRQIGTVGAGWTNELYTLTAQHMHCKDIPGFIDMSDPIFRQLKQELYSLFSGRIRADSIVFESDGEPHLVKYHGRKSKGTVMHTDNNNPELVYITLNVLLSEEEDFTGGGTYIKVIDKTIHLKQGEMLIHLGDLEHAGMEIHSGVRRLLISFFACEWEKSKVD